jgi:hypothetical protein
MTIEDIAEHSFVAEINDLEVESFCQQEKITPDAFMDRFAQHIVTGYLAGRFAWPSCDAAMNRLNRLFFKYRRYHGYAFDAFLAFETGENRQEGKTPDEIVRPWIDKLISKYPVR